MTIPCSGLLQENSPSLPTFLSSFSSSPSFRSVPPQELLARPLLGGSTPTMATMATERLILQDCFNCLIVSSFFCSCRNRRSSSQSSPSKQVRNARRASFSASVQDRTNAKTRALLCEYGVYYKQSCSYVPSVASNNPPNHVASHTLSVKTQGLIGEPKSRKLW